MMMGLDFVFLAAIIGAIAYAFGWRPKFNQAKPAQPDQKPSEILKTRYARGEINREEYDQMSRDLEG
jgi:putative membrane protein